MQITWNGTGAAWSYHFGNSSAVLEADGKRLLIDCGHTVPARLHKMGLALTDIDAVFISHLHGDHIYGLEEWGFRSFLQYPPYHNRPTLLIADTLPLRLWRNVLTGTMGQVCDNRCLLRDFFNVVVMRVGEPTRFGPWTLELRPVRHVPNTPSYGVKVRTENAAASFTCDSLADADAWFYEGAQVVFHDCSFTPYFPTTVHAHFEEILAYPQALREKTSLVHYDDSVQEKCGDPEWRDKIARAGMRLTEPYKPLLLG